MLRGALELFDTLTSPDEIMLEDYAAALGSAPETLKALERVARSLNLYVNLGDLDGQVTACDKLSDICRSGSTRGNGSALLARSVLDQGTLPSLVVLLQTGRPEPCRAAACLLAEICVGTDQRRAVLRSGVVKPLVALLRRANEDRLLREGARVLAALALEPLALGALLREGAPRALKHLCRSHAVQSHALAVAALGRLARHDASLLESSGLARVFCVVASNSVLDARASACSEIRDLLLLPSRRARLLAAGCVRVLLRCCDVLNESLKLTALHGLATLLTAARMPDDVAAASSPEQRATDASDADDARELAYAQMGELGGFHVLVMLSGDAQAHRTGYAPAVVERAIQLLEYISRDAAAHPALEAAKLPALIVSHLEAEADVERSARNGGVGSGGSHGGGSHGGGSGSGGGKAGGGGGVSRFARAAAKGGVLDDLDLSWSADNPSSDPHLSLHGEERSWALLMAREAGQSLHRFGSTLQRITDGAIGRRADQRRADIENYAENGAPANHALTMALPPSSGIHGGGMNGPPPLAAVPSSASSSSHALVVGGGGGGGGGGTAEPSAPRPFLELGAPASYAPLPTGAGATRVLVVRTVANLLASPTAQLSIMNAGGLPHIVVLVNAGLPPADAAGTEADQDAGGRRRGILALTRGGSGGSGGSGGGGSGGGGGSEGGYASGGGDLRREVIRSLARLCGSAVHLHAVMREGALPALLRSLQGAHASNDERALRHAASAIGALTALPEAQLQMATLGAVPEVVRLSRSRDSDTRRHAARAIGHLAGNAQCQKQIGTAGGLRPLIKCGYARSSDLQQLVVQAVANLALDPELNQLLVAEGAQQLLLTLIRSKSPEVVHWAHVAQGNLEAASALGPLIQHCPTDNVVTPVDMLTMSALVTHLRSHDPKVSIAVRRLTASAVANLLVSAHNQRLLLECNGVKPLVALASEALEPELHAQCMRAIANLAVTPEYRANLLQARALPLIISALKAAQLHSSGSHTFAVLAHAARALGNLCAGGDVASAMQQKAAAEGAVATLLPLITRAAEYLQDLRSASAMSEQLSGVDALLREVTRALAKLALLRANQRAIAEGEGPMLVLIGLLAPTADVSIGVKQEALDLLNALASQGETLRLLVANGAIPALVALLHVPDPAVETSAAELLAKLAQVGEFAGQISQETLPLLVELLHSQSPAAALAALHALNELLFESRPNQLVALRSGIVPPCVQLARSDDDAVNSNAATLLCQMVLADAADVDRERAVNARAPKGSSQVAGGSGSGGSASRLSAELRLSMMASMAMSSNAEAHSVAAMGLATMTNASELSPSLIAKQALQPLVRLGRASTADTQAAALDALSSLAELPDVQVDLVRAGALRMLFDRAASPGKEAADIRSLALTTITHLASNGANMDALRSVEVRNRLRGLTSTLASEPAVMRAVEAIEQSVEAISSLLELQGKQRPLAKGDVAAMSECVTTAGLDASISREVGHTCAAVGAQKANVALFIADGGIELLNSLARARSATVQIECAQALVAFCRAREAHQALSKQGGLTSLVHLARSPHPELMNHIATAFSVLAEQQAPKTWLVQAGCVPFLFAFIRNGDAEAKYLAAKTLMYLR